MRRNVDADSCKISNLRKFHKEGSEIYLNQGILYC